jgi:hypothetical protein
MRRRQRLPPALLLLLVVVHGGRTPSNLNLAFVWLEVGEIWAVLSLSFFLLVLLLRLVLGRSFLQWI